MEKETFIITGLGNPGPAYEHTRHNAGFDTLTLLENKLGIPLRKKMLKGLIGEGTVNDAKIVLCAPQTFMNLSGECVSQLLTWYHCPADHLLVIYDDIDLPVGKLRVRKNGSAGTHNGMRNILLNIATQNFPRIRIGTGAKPEGWDLADWVLSRYQTDEEKQLMQEAFQRAADCAADWLEHGIEHAMQTYNRA